MDYSDAITWLSDNNITKDDGSVYKFGEVSLLLDAMYFQANLAHYIYNYSFPMCIVLSLLLFLHLIFNQVRCYLF